MFWSVAVVYFLVFLFFFSTRSEKKEVKGLMSTVKLQDFRQALDTGERTTCQNAQAAAHTVTHAVPCRAMLCLIDLLRNACGDVCVGAVVLNSTRA